MLELHELKNWVHRDISRLDKVLLVLASLDIPTTLVEIRARSSEAGLNSAKKWNLSQILGNSGGKAIRTPTGWEISNQGIDHLRGLGIGNISPAALKVAVDLRKQLERISEQNIKKFVEEAISCHENEFYRSAIVMSWLGAMAVLHHHIHQNHLAAFNTEAARVSNKWKTAITTDDLGRMGESDFLDRITAMSLIGKNVKDELQGCLKSRNGCGHPNTLQVGPNKSAAHIETLLKNVFEVY